MGCFNKVVSFCRVDIISQPSVLRTCTLFSNRTHSSISTRSRTYTTDISQPSSTWSVEAVQLFHRLNELTKDEKWMKLPRYSQEGLDKRSMITAVGDKMYSGAVFICISEMMAKSVVTFGPWLQGGPNHVHGGAVAAIHDSSMGLTANICVAPSVTAYLNNNFRRGLKLGTTVLLSSKVDRIEGRKIFLSSKMTCPDEKIVYSDATALFIAYERDET